MGAYYNEIDPYAAQWLRNLISAGHIPDGDVDERSIADVQPVDIADYTQCHFFAGIGGWSYALRLSGWPEDRPVWTGSCPCQPFSVAGRGKGTDDERHLWPVFARLIAERKPSVVFGEQVASKAGREWLAGVRSDLEGVGYAVGAADLCAAGVGAPHIRQRLFWVAHTHRQQNDEEQQGPTAAEGGGRSDGIGGRGLDCGMANADDAGREGRQLLSECPDELSPWSRGVEWRRGADGKTRRVKSDVCLLVNGVPARVGRLRAYGNAIVPQVAAEVIRAFMDA